jgi:hypothetical protein
LIRLLAKPSPVFIFLRKMACTTKSAQRTLALDVVRKLVNDDLYPLPEEVEVALVQCMKKGIKDQAPSVRASAMNAISSVIPRASDRILACVGVIHGYDGVTPLLHDLANRIRDEKLTVRKSALKCLRAMAFRAQEVGSELYGMIAGRTRDRSLTMRQESASILSKCLNWIGTPELILLWYDSVLPLALDPDTKTQELALKLLDECLFSVITHEGLPRAVYLTNSHLDLLTKIFPVYQQKELNLKPLCSSLERLLVN